MKRFWAMFTKKRIARELDDELQTHLELLAADFAKQGMTREEARLAALRSMGNLAGMKEEYRDARGLPLLETLLQNIRYAARVLRKNPGFTAVAAFALALGIGANTAIYSLADVMLLHPIDIPRLDRVVNVVGTIPGYRLGVASMSPGDFTDFRAQSRTVEQLACFYEHDVNLTGGGEPEKDLAAYVSADFFEAMQASPMLGRPFHAAADYSGLPHVAVLSYRLWEERYGGDPNVVGRTVRINGVPYEIVGVMGREFQYPTAAGLWVPMLLGPPDLTSHDAMFLTAVGRLRPGVSAAEATAELNVIARGIARRNPRNHEHRGAVAEPMADNINGNAVRPIMTMLMGAALFVLLLASVNVANLQLARVSLRAREIALRFAVGASRWRIVAQFLMESVVLSLVGAAAGALVGVWATKMLRGMVPGEVLRFIPSWGRLGVNFNALLFTLAVGAAAGIVSGIAPALFASRTQLEEALKEGGRSASGGTRRHRLRNVFVAAQIVLAMVLLVGAVMMAKGLTLVTEPAPNLDPAHALTLRVTLPPAQYTNETSRRNFAQSVLERVSAIPGVRSAALIRDLPYTNYHYSVSILTEGRPQDHATLMEDETISPAYFETMRLPLVAGRAFDAGDIENEPGVAIVSASFARREFPHDDPLGKRVRFGPPEANHSWLTIIGVAGDVRSDPFERSASGVLYRPIRQMPVDQFCVLVRAANPGGVAAAVVAAIHTVDAELPVYDVMTLEKVFGLQVSPVRMIASLMGSFGVLALLLSSVGVYSIMAHAVSERRREIGVRVAMGAERRQVVWMFLRQSLWLAGIGMLIGAPAAYGLARLLEGFFFGVHASDAAVFAMAVLVITSSAALASWSAARRAAGIDPVATLREE